MHVFKLTVKTGDHASCHSIHVYEYMCVHAQCTCVRTDMHVHVWVCTDMHVHVMIHVHVHVREQISHPTHISPAHRCSVCSSSTVLPCSVAVPQSSGQGWESTCLGIALWQG